MSRRALGAATTGVALAAGAGVVAHLLPGVSSWRQLRCRLTPGLAGMGTPGHVALTFDDGPDPASTPQFLDLLDQLGWQATFFLLGRQVTRYPDLAAEVARRGHEIGVHGDEHRSHLRHTSRWVTADVTRARDVIAAATDLEPRWFRPPYGAMSASSLVAAHRTGLQTVLWTSWGKDWRADATAETVARNIANTFEPGPTVLLHDSDVTSAPGSWRATLGALPLLADRWERSALQVGTLGRHHVPATWRG